MTAEETCKAIGKSNTKESYEIILLINNGKIEETSSHIQGIYSCTHETAMEVSHMFETILWKNRRPKP